MYSEDFIMSPKVDFAFKELMRDEMVRKGFLSAVLNIKDTDIQSTVLMNTNLPRVHEDDKQSILDVRLTMNNNTEINIEIQLAYMSSWADRSTFYLSKYSGFQLYQKDKSFSYSVSHYRRYGTYQVYGYSGDAHCRTAEITCRR